MSGSRSMRSNQRGISKPGGRDRHDAGERQVGPLGEPQRDHAAERVARDHHVLPARPRADERGRERVELRQHGPSSSGDAVPKPGRSTAIARRSCAPSSASSGRHVSAESP